MILSFGIDLINFRIDNELGRLVVVHSRAFADQTVRLSTPFVRVLHNLHRSVIVILASDNILGYLPANGCHICAFVGWLKRAAIALESLPRCLFAPVGMVMPTGATAGLLNNSSIRRYGNFRTGFGLRCEFLG